MKQKRMILAFLVICICMIFIPSALSEASFGFENYNYTVSIGKSVTIMPRMQGFDSDLHPALSWSSSDESIASVKNGKVKGLRNGTAIITCLLTINEQTSYHASYTLQVFIPVKQITPDEKKVVLLIGKPYTLTTTISPDNATNQKLIYTSSDPNIATVNDVGIVSAKKVGSCHITMQTSDGSNKKASIAVKVPHIVYEKKKYTISTPDSLQIYYWTQGYGTFGDAYTSEYIDVTSSSSLGFQANETTMTVKPKKAGNACIYLFYNGFPTARINVKVEHSAVYDNVSYPRSKYKNIASMDSDDYGKPVSFTCQVVKLSPDKIEYTMLALDQSQQDIVIISGNNGLVENQKVTIFGLVEQPITLKTETGLQVQYPYIQVKKIITQ
ncbi:MAG TPA: Ig-like domain-containing protein [Candidatus Limiplasma sp.]|nr:Ig-like domain-containing protein [Candidatus Limiplasma sp.]HPR78923.1 Ig-like domain-containing protein [Candidatus Limiplasma sp.]